MSCHLSYSGWSNRVQTFMLVFISHPIRPEGWLTTAMKQKCIFLHIHCNFFVASFFSFAVLSHLANMHFHLNPKIIQKFHSVPCNTWSLCLWSYQEREKNSKFVKYSMLPWAGWKCKISCWVMRIVIFFCIFSLSLSVADSYRSCIRFPMPAPFVLQRKTWKNSCELTLKSSNSLLIYFISYLHAILYLFLNILYFLSRNKKY